jgi:hypothetical protein
MAQRAAISEPRAPHRSNFIYFARHIPLALWMHGFLLVADPQERL